MKKIINILFSKYVFIVSTFFFFLPFVIEVAGHDLPVSIGKYVYTSVGVILTIQVINSFLHTFGIMKRIEDKIAKQHIRFILQMLGYIPALIGVGIVSFFQIMRTGKLFASDTLFSFGILGMLNLFTCIRILKKTGLLDFIKFD